MQFILDHLSALIISSVVILIIVSIQVRGTYSMIETHVSETVQNDVQSLHEILEWELTQMATEDYITSVALPEGRFHGASGTFQCWFDQDPVNGNTRTFVFPTFDRPFGIPDSLQPPPDSVDIIEVKYSLVPYGDSLSVWSDTAFQHLGLYRLERSVNDTLTGYLNEVITDFRVEQVSLGGGPEGYIGVDGPCPTDMRRIRYEYKMLNQGMDFATNDQLNTNRLNQGQFGMTVNLEMW